MTSPSGTEPPRTPRVYLNGATIMTTTTRDSLEVARRTGFAGIEVRAERLLDAPDELAEATRTVRPGEVWSINGLQLQLDRDGRLDTARIAIELPPRLAIATAIGAAFLLVVPPRAPGADPERTIDAMREGLRIVAGSIDSAGIRAAFEFLGFGDCPINSPEMAGRVVAGLDDVGLVVDSCHWHASGAGSLDSLDVDRIEMIHLNDVPDLPPRSIEDRDRVLPGDGVIELGRLVSELSGRGYRGPFSLETFNPAYWTADPMTIAARGRTAVERVIDHAAP
jgi:2-keto-myo-inositol isomerase